MLRIHSFGERRIAAVLAIIVVVVSALAIAGAADAAREERYTIEGKILAYDVATQTFKVQVTSAKWTGFGKSPAGKDAPKDVKVATEMMLAVKPDGSVLSRTVVKSVSGGGLDNSGTQEGFSKAVATIPNHMAVVFSVTENPGAKSKADAPKYLVRTVLIRLSEEELEKRFEAVAEEVE